MALDIGALFGAYSAGTKELLRRAGLPETLYADAPGAAPAAPPTPAQAAAAAAPGPSQAGGKTGMSPQEQYLQAAAKYAANRPGGWAGLLEARAAANTGRRFGAVQGVTAQPGSSTGNALERLLRVASTGPRAGQAFQSFERGGQQFHVYFDPKTGKRQVIGLSR
jgi:hypothetical protein